jgi:cytochrome c/protein-L-isoaspartate O-methyltransferase
MKGMIWSLICVGWVFLLHTAAAQDATPPTTVVPAGINDGFKSPDLKIDEWLEKFEVESREVYAARDEVLKACAVQPGERIADVGAGTGFYSQLFAKTTGWDGWVYSVDIAPKFLQHIVSRATTDGIENLTTVLCTDVSIRLPPESVDLVFICDTYHHFESPQQSLSSILRALKPGGRLVLIDFNRIPSVSREFLIDHVRANKETFRDEIIAAGFEFTDEVTIEAFKENYLLRFKKPLLANANASRAKPTKSFADYPPGPLGETVRLGETLVKQTSHHPLTKPFVGNQLNCTSCHLDAGQHPKAASFIGVASAYPAYSPRKSAVITLEDRIGHCFARSQNGTHPTNGSTVSVAIAAYITWLSQQTPIAMNPDAPLGPNHIQPLNSANVQANVTNGQSLFSDRCAECHGEDGAGSDESPPVWGQHSFNDGAGLAKVPNLASWLKVAMPPEDTNLTDQEAFDVAAYVHLHSRPKFGTRSE